MPKCGGRAGNLKTTDTFIVVNQLASIKNFPGLAICAHKNDKSTALLRREVTYVNGTPITLGK